MHRSTLLAGAAIVTLVGFAGTTQAATDAAPSSTSITSFTRRR